MTLSEIVKRFGKVRLLRISKELVRISEELGDESDLLDIKEGTHSYTIVQAIQRDMNDNGVPNDDDMSDDLFDFCIAAGILDEDGNIVDEEAGGDNKEEIELPDKFPQCWGMADEADTACSRCRLVDLCCDQRIKARPRCFGVLFNVRSEKCAGSENGSVGCLEYILCRDRTEANAKAGKIKSIK